MSMYFGNKLLFKQALLMTIEYYLLFLIIFFQESLLFFLCWELDGKGIVSYLLHLCLRRYFWLPSGVE